MRHCVVFVHLTRFPVGKQSRKHKPSIIDYIVVGNDKAGHYIAADALCAGGTSDHRMLIYELDGSILTRNISSTPVKRIRKKKLCLFPDLRNDFSVDFKQSKTLNRIKRIEAQGRKQKKPLAEVAAHCSKILGEQLRKSAKKICGETASVSTVGDARVIFAHSWKWTPLPSLHVVTSELRTSDV